MNSLQPLNTSALMNATIAAHALELANQDNRTFLPAITNLRIKMARTKTEVGLIHEGFQQVITTQRLCHNAEIQSVQRRIEAFAAKERAELAGGVAAAVNESVVNLVESASVQVQKLQITADAFCKATASLESPLAHRMEERFAKCLEVCESNICSSVEGYSKRAANMCS